MDLTTAVQAWTQTALHLAEADLERPWAWGAYDSEGVRFSFFRTYEELRDLAARIQAERGGQSEASLILAQYLAAVRDLQAVLLAFPPAKFDTPPAEGEWSLHEILKHMYSSTLNFTAVVQLGLEHQRAGLPMAKPTNEDYDRLLGTDEQFDAMIELGSADEYLAAFEHNRQQLTGQFKGVTDSELGMLPYFWDGQMELRFRLHRFDSHMRQHTVQIEKLLQSLNIHPSETQRLLRHIYQAWADVEGALIGAEHTLTGSVREVASAIAFRAQEISA